MRFVSKAIKTCVVGFGYSSRGVGPKLTQISSNLIVSVSFMLIENSFIPQHVYAQQIIIDSSAPSSTLFSNSGNGSPQINIATPQSGVSAISESVEI